MTWSFTLQRRSGISGRDLCYGVWSKQKQREKPLDLKAKDLGAHRGDGAVAEVRELENLAFQRYPQLAPPAVGLPRTSLLHAASAFSPAR